MNRALLLSVFLALAGPLPAVAEQQTEVTGGDLYIGGSGTASGIEADRDLFAAGGTIAVDGRVSQDAHLAGGDVQIEADVSDDVYAVGMSVTARGRVGQDLTAAGMSVRVAGSAEIVGNARLSGATIVVDGPIGGALVASGGEVILNGPIAGDARIFAGKLSFGPAARIGGTLRYSAPDEIVIPPGVIDPERVRFERLSRMETVREVAEGWRDREMPMIPTFRALFAGFLVTLAFFVILAAVALSVWPDRIEAARQDALSRPGHMLLAGVLGLATALGLVPISVMTVVGIPILPVILLAIVVIWTLGYAFGAYVVALRVWAGMGGGEPEMPGRLAVFAAGILVVALLNVIPFLGWVINFTLVLFGIGALAAPLLARFSAPPARTAE